MFEMLIILSGFEKHFGVLLLVLKLIKEFTGWADISYVEFIEYFNKFIHDR